GNLLTSVQTGLGTAQATHQVHDAVQLVGLERQQPLVVVQSEGGDGVGTHVRVRGGHATVVGEHLAALVLGQQVPLVGTHERVHADVAQWLFSGEERRNVATVELGGTVQPHHRPHRGGGPAHTGAAEAAVGALQLFVGVGDPPEHDVRVGPKTLHVVGPPRGDPT